MSGSNIIFSLFLVFTGAAVFATVALYARQALLVAYIFLGMVLGPWGLGIVGDPAWIGEVANVGIMFLLFLLGLNMLPQQLWRIFREAISVTLLSSLAFLIIGVLLALALGYSAREAAFIGAALMFSSTIIGLKLLPTTALHHRHTGQVIVSVLLLQDLLAIIVLLVLEGYGKGGNLALEVGLQLLHLPMLIGVAYILERFLILPLISRFDQIHEYIFLLTIGWCLGIAQFGQMLGLSHAIGAFVAGVMLATSPIALFIAESLKPLRDFFLILFFFSLGAKFNVELLTTVVIPASLFAGAMLVIKPLVFKHLLIRAGEQRSLSREIGVRLGQNSEFALLIAVLAADSKFINHSVSYLSQMTTLITFVVSSYVVVLRYPTPIAVSDRLRRD